MKNLKQPVILGLLAAISIGIGLWAGMQSESNKAPGYPDLGGDFTLMSDKGPVRLEDFRGKVVPIYFGFTHCPDVCITSLSAIAAALDKLTDDERSQIQPLFISIDPERDDPARVGEYARYFDPSIIGLTGSLDEVSKVALIMNTDALWSVFNCKGMDAGKRFGNYTCSAGFHGGLLLMLNRLI